MNISFVTRTEGKHFPEATLFLEGTKGTIQLFPDYWVHVTTDAGTLINRYPPPRYPWADPAYDVNHASMVPIHQDFLRALTSGGQPENSGADNLQTMKLVYAAYDSAMSLAQAGDVRGAVGRLEELAKKQPRSEYTAKAAVDAALLRIRHGEPDRGCADLEAAMKTYPQEEAGLSSLQKLVRRKDETVGEAGTVAWLEGLRGSFESTRLGETILYERARRLRSLGKKEEASAAYVECATKYPYPYGAHFDDALFHASELEEELGRPKEAVALLLRMLHERETAHMMGSYQRPLYDDALFRAAKLSEEKLGDRARARELYHQLFTDHTTSILRDDAIWREAELWQADGDGAKACSRLEDMVDKLPDTRFVPCAIQKCPSIARPKKSRAPAECHAYLTRPKTAE